MSQSETELRSSEGRIGPSDDRPLTEQEYQLLQRLLGDPFSFPIQFKTWLVSYLESSDLNLPISAINGLTRILGVSGAGEGTLGILPAGLIFPYGGDTAPNGSLLCNGAAYSRTAEARLFEAIGTRFGAPDVNSFYVPDIQERIPVGKGTHPDHDAIGKNDGLALGQRRVRHKHRLLGWNNETVIAYEGTGTPVSVLKGDAETSELGVHDHAPADGLPSPTGGPGFLTVNFIIVN